MKYRIYWGLSIFLILVIAATTYKVISNRREIAEIKSDPSTKQLSKQAEQQSQSEPQTLQNTVTNEHVENIMQNTENSINETVDLRTATSLDEKIHPVSIDIDTKKEEISDESPYGFGPYPEVPLDYIERHGQPVWYRQDAKNLPDPTLRELELINRVKIQTWIEGDRNFTSGVYENGKVYLNYPNTFYVTYKNITFPDGTRLRYISSALSGQELPLTPEQIFAGEKPKGVNLIDIEAQEAGIEPFSFLGLD